MTVTLRSCWLAPRVRVRQATPAVRPAGLPAIAKLVPLAGVRLEDTLTEGVRDEFTGAAPRRASGDRSRASN
ncbi:hypothetical protein [Nonomuraea sp. NPDC049784]|uniref:hypothetical protein n=1 Tax=Nonomuraea sp. NPDC049784 TaxID=3154361 RepID=UPI0033E431D9